MFLKITEKKYKDKVYRHAAIVESIRKDRKTTHRVVQNIGRIRDEKDLRRAKEIEKAYKKGEKIIRLGDISISQTREYGLLWAAEELWRKCGVFDALRDATSDRRTEFDFERIVFLLVVNRLYEPGSDFSALRWIKNEAFPRIEVEKQWLYRSLDKLAEEKEEIEEELLKNLRKSLNLSLDMVFYDLTSTYFEGEGPDLADFGYSRDKRRDRKQIVLGVIMADGIPIAHRVWAGNTADKSTLKRSVKDLRERFGIGNVTFVADRGVISPGNLEDLEEEGYEYILSTKRRRDNLAKELLVKEVPGTGKVRTREVRSTGGRRYILCLNEDRRKNDLEKLKSIRESCEEELQKLKERFDESRKGNRRGRPMTKSGAMRRVQRILGRNKRLFDVSVGKTLEWKLNEEAWEYERAIAGKFLLVTSTDLSPWDVMVAYKNLKDVERAFDELKNLIKLRPIYHRVDERVRGHVFVCHLALLTKRLITGGSYSNERLRELKALKVHELGADSERMWIRNEITGSQARIFDILNLTKPPKIAPGA